VVRSFFELNYIQTLRILEIKESFIKAKLVRNGIPSVAKLYPNDLFGINWMIPPKINSDFELLHY
jgi:hypothetical protein